MKEGIRFYGTAAEIKLTDNGAGHTETSEIQIMKTGEFVHPEYGKFKVTDADLDAFKLSFDKHVRGLDIAIDVAHEPDKGAVGWIKSVYKKGTDALFALVEWTKEGATMLKEGKFKYISPDFQYMWKDEKGKAYRNVLMGAALTNRPWWKGMEPVMLSEGLAEEDGEMRAHYLAEKTKSEDEGGDKMKDVKGLKGKIAKLMEDTQLSEDAFCKKLAEIVKDHADPAEEKGDEKGKKLSEEVVTLSESVKTLNGQIKTLTDAKDAAELQLKEKDADDLIAANIKVGKLAPAQKAWARNYALTDKSGFEAWAKDAPVVIKMGEIGAAGDGNEGGQEIMLTEEEKKTAKEFGNSEEAVLAQKKLDKGVKLSEAEEKSLGIKK